MRYPTAVFSVLVLLSCACLKQRPVERYSMAHVEAAEKCWVGDDVFRTGVTRGPVAGMIPERCRTMARQAAKERAVRLLSDYVIFQMVSSGRLGSSTDIRDFRDSLARAYRPLLEGSRIIEEKTTPGEGCSITIELSHKNLRLLLLEQGADVTFQR